MVITNCTYPFLFLYRSIWIKPEPALVAGNCATKPSTAATSSAETSTEPTASTTTSQTEATELTASSTSNDTEEPTGPASSTCNVRPNTRKAGMKRARKTGPLDWQQNIWDDFSKSEDSRQERRQ